MHACYPHKSNENEQARRESRRFERRERDESTRAPMEMKLSASDKKKRPPSRLQKQAPATLRLEPPAAPSPTGAWAHGRVAIPLLSPLVVSPSAAWEAADQLATGASRRDGGVQGGGGGGGHPDARIGREGTGAARAHGCNNGDRQADDAAKAPTPCGGGGWRHPALPTPVAEPASLVPFFQSQCALEVHNAQQ